MEVQLDICDSSSGELSLLAARRADQGVCPRAMVLYFCQQVFQTRGAEDMEALQLPGLTVDVQTNGALQVLLQFLQHVSH